ncbi:hypothetical protein ABWL39_16790 [Chitinivorax sp. PXF-14]|uniref:hypothetical protein n=1 Tax=Chitinivorax sp. PXF-14 TaxID=3230488 RepID=UPI003467290C
MNPQSAGTIKAMREKAMRERVVDQVNAQLVPADCPGVLSRRTIEYKSEYIFCSTQANQRQIKYLPMIFWFNV